MSEKMTSTVKAARWLEKNGIKGDTIVKRDASKDGGAIYLYDLLANFARRTDIAKQELDYLQVGNERMQTELLDADPEEVNDIRESLGISHMDAKRVVTYENLIHVLSDLERDDSDPKLHLMARMLHILIDEAYKDLRDCY